MATTLTQVRTNVSAILGLDNSTTGDQPQIDFYANEAVRKTLMDTRCYVTSATITPGATADYTLTTSALEVIEIYGTSDSQNYSLERRSVAEIIQRRQASTSAGPTRYYAMTGNNLFMWYPTPSATDTFTLYYVPQPTEMATGANDLSVTTYGGVPTSIFDCVENYVLWKMADLDDDASSSMGEKYRALYEDAIRKARKHLRDRGGTRLGPARIRHRGALVAHDRSTYP